MKKKNIVVLLGDSGVGSKTSFLNRVIDNTFDPSCMSTSGGVYAEKIINLYNGKVFNIDFWDTPGQERYRSLNKPFLKNTDCIMLGYDVTRIESFKNIKEFWYKFSKEYSEADLIYLVGNKIDLYEDRCVEEDEALKYCEEMNIKYFEISCKISSGIQKLIDDLTDQLIKK